MAPLSLARRIRLVVGALAIVVVLFHDAIALGLVARGDDAFATSDATHAIAYYDRAAFFAPNDAVVADRTASVALLGGSLAEKTHALDRVRRALVAVPSSIVLRADRARLAHAVREDAESCDVYRDLGATTNDWRFSEFAGQCARHLGRVADARRAFTRVVELMPSNGIARHALISLVAREQLRRTGVPIDPGSADGSRTRNTPRARSRATPGS